MVGWLMTEYGRTWKIAVVAYFQDFCGVCLEGLREIMGISIRIARFHAESGFF
jgi:hypothetical protein